MVNSDNDSMNTWYKESISILSDYIRICYQVINSATIEPYWKNRAHQEASRIELIQDLMFETDPLISFIKYWNDVETINLRLKRRAELATMCDFASIK